MKPRELQRVVFFSKNDGSWAYNLKKAESLLPTLAVNSQSDINDLMEVSHIKMYFDNEMFLPSWDSNTKARFVDIVDNAWKSTKASVLSLNNDNIHNITSNLEYNYTKSFWSLVDNLRTYERIDKSVFTSILNNTPIFIRDILQLKQTVKYYDNEIRCFLLEYDKSAELLLSNFEEAHDYAEPNYRFPKSLSLDDKADIISRYIDSEDANLNYIQLIENSNSGELKLSPKIKLQAKKKALELRDEMFNEKNSTKYSVEVSLDKDQEEPAKFSNENNILKCSYSYTYFDKQGDNIELFLLFMNPFMYLDGKGLIKMVSKDAEIDTLEKIFMKSKNEYLIGEVFHKKAYLSTLQIVIFDHYLLQKNNSVEKLIHSFIDEYLDDVLGMENVQFRLPTMNASYLEKIRVLAPEFEFLLKQFAGFADDGEIDLELLKINSAPLRLSEIQSLLKLKYLYANNSTMESIQYYFFSDQSHLFYVEPFKEKHSNLYDLLLNDDVPFDNFKDYQKETIQKLLDEEYLHIVPGNIVKIKKTTQLRLIGELYWDQVLSYWHYPKSARDIMDEMISTGLLSNESTLFTRPEISYLNFHLNKREFTNGLDLRNKYLHGTNNSSEREHKADYYILLKLIVLALLKIRDELIIARHVASNYR